MAETERLISGRVVTLSTNLYNDDHFSDFSLEFFFFTAAAGRKRKSLRNSIGIRLTAVEVVENKLYQSRDFIIF